LGRGEREAISLAEQLKADALLLDDWKAWKAAEARGLVVTGTLNVLEAAAQQGLLDLSEAFARLRRTTFHVTPELMQSILDRQPRRTAQEPSASESE
jgi:predicted nucleic acid-binding protein